MPRYPSFDDWTGRFGLNAMHWPTRAVVDETLRTLLHGDGVPNAPSYGGLGEYADAWRVAAVDKTGRVRVPGERKQRGNLVRRRRRAVSR